MAYQWHYLQAITSHEVSPFRFLRKYNLPAADETRILGGWQGRIPNNWQMSRAWIEFVTDANAGNRYVHANITTNNPSISEITGSKVEEYISEAVPATSTFNIYFDRNSDRTGITAPGSHIRIGDLSWTLKGNDCFKLYVSGNKAGDLISWYIEWQFLNWKLGVHDESEPAIKRKGWFW